MTARPRMLSATAFVAALLAFTLPFGAVESCDGEEVRFTGVELVTYDVEPDLSTSSPVLHDQVEENAGLLALAVLVAAAAGLAIAALGRRWGGLCASLALAAAQLLGMAIVVSGSGGGGPLVGFWLALAALAAAGLVHLVVAARNRQHAGHHVGRYVVWRAALALSPTLALLTLIAVLYVGA